MTKLAVAKPATTPTTKQLSKARSKIRPLHNNKKALHSVAAEYTAPNSPWLKFKSARISPPNNAIKYVCPGLEQYINTKPNNIIRQSCLIQLSGLRRTPEEESPIAGLSLVDGLIVYKERLEIGAQNEYKTHSSKSKHYNLYSEHCNQTGLKTPLGLGYIH